MKQNVDVQTVKTQDIKQEVNSISYRDGRPLKLEDSALVTAQMWQQKRHIDMSTKRHFSILFQLSS